MFDIPGTFTVRGFSKPETLRGLLSARIPARGRIESTMAFDANNFA